MELQLLAQAVRRSFVLIVTCVVLGAALGTAAWRLLPAGYEASAVLVMDSTAVTVPGQAPFAGDPERYVTGELESLQSFSAATAAAQLLDPSPTARQVLSDLRLSHVTGSDVVTVTAAADSPADAVALANAVVDSYVDRRAEAAQSALDGQRAALQDQAGELTDRLADEALSPSLASALQTQYAQVASDLAELSLPGAVRDATRVADGAREAAAVRPVSLPLSVLGAAALCGLVALLVAVTRAVRRPRVAGEWRVEELTGRPVEAVFRRAGRRPGRGVAPATRLVALMEPVEPEDSPLVISVCDAGAARGRSAVVSALASRLAAEGRRVVAVTPRRPGDRPLVPQAELAVHGDRGWQSGTVGTGVTVFSHPEPGELTAEDFVKALPDWSNGADVVLVDAGSLLDSTFAGAAVRASGRAVLVVPVGDQVEADLRLAVDVLATMPGTRQHVVVTTP
ncbi:hypothetical protein [Modestobacter altitudinis]|uniref:hypothetical protein n=1 Tax=Modestobacter altitudinis TaxID=2213158 RepID=UPI00110CDAD7|nr:hypothetical protein [Modestobacter altitudinis]